MNCDCLINDSSSIKDVLSKFDIDDKDCFKRYVLALNKYRKYFNDDNISVFKTPGRIEICGNHTDHQNGQIIAAAIDVDTIAVVSKANHITIYSEGFSVIKLTLDDIGFKEEEKFTSIALIKGVLNRFRQIGLNVGGFNAYITSNINSGSGMSSSANFTVLIATIIDHLYNQSKTDKIEIAKIAQYSEVKYFCKPVGLMDQLACAFGGIIHVNFKEPDSPVVTKIDNIFKKHNQILALVMTRTSHENLNNEYSAIVDEMKMVAKHFDQDLLSQLSHDFFYDNVDKLININNERAILRSHHFFTENERVEKLLAAINNDNLDHVHILLKQSGYSSYMYLQNVYLPNDHINQNMALILAMTEYFFNDKMASFRVHGGGFGGTILVCMDESLGFLYKQFIEKLTGANTCKFVHIDEQGSICLLE
ncbi:MAG: galactokinase family protein [Erysipelotrichaceae bacterium]|nr:galactokinase family protein [Erysipelotrichaceae bacterium]MDD3924348.1 galactokinase family protein [Erysipelotrichaceae bacterium]MDD4642202.1 galactokinase family protein [Erysipelotrichaceae bacterium]